jgi:hypothetical protein
LETTEPNGDRSARAVYVVDSDLAEYDVVLMPYPESSAQWNAMVGDMDPDRFTVALIAPPANKDIAVYTNLLPVLAGSPIPTVVIPGAGNLPAFESIFGPAVYAVRVGPDAFLRFPNSYGLAGREGRLHELRRSIRSSRWSVGVSAASWQEWGTRTQLTLLVDNPLDVHFALGVSKTKRKSPWGTTVFYAGPGAMRTVYRLTTNGIEPK